MGIRMVRTLIIDQTR